MKSLITVLSIVLCSGVVQAQVAASAVPLRRVLPETYSQITSGAINAAGDVVVHAMDSSSTEGLWIVRSGQAPSLAIAYGSPDGQGGTFNAGYSPTLFIDDAGAISFDLGSGLTGAVWSWTGSLSVDFSGGDPCPDGSGLTAQLIGSYVSTSGVKVISTENCGNYMDVSGSGLQRVDEVGTPISGHPEGLSLGLHSAVTPEAINGSQYYGRAIGACVDSSGDPIACPPERTIGTQGIMRSSGTGWTGLAFISDHPQGVDAGDTLRDYTRPIQVNDAGAAVFQGSTDMIGWGLFMVDAAGQVQLVAAPGSPAVGPSSTFTHVAVGTDDFWIDEAGDVYFLAVTQDPSLSGMFRYSAGTMSYAFATSGTVIQGIAEPTALTSARTIVMARDGTFFIEGPLDASSSSTTAVVMARADGTYRLIARGGAVYNDGTTSFSIPGNSVFEIGSNRTNGMSGRGPRTVNSAGQLLINSSSFGLLLAETKQLLPPPTTTDAGIVTPPDAALTVRSRWIDLNRIEYRVTIANLDSVDAEQITLTASAANILVPLDAQDVEACDNGEDGDETRDGHLICTFVEGVLGDPALPAGESMEFVFVADPQAPVENFTTNFVLASSAGGETTTTTLEHQTPWLGNVDLKIEINELNVDTAGASTEVLYEIVVSNHIDSVLARDVEIDPIFEDLLGHSQHVSWSLGEYPPCESTEQCICETYGCTMPGLAPGNTIYLSAVLRKGVEDARFKYGAKIKSANTELTPEDNIAELEDKVRFVDTSTGCDNCDGCQAYSGTTGFPVLLLFGLRAFLRLLESRRRRRGCQARERDPNV